MVALVDELDREKIDFDGGLKNVALWYVVRGDMWEQNWRLVERGT